jgi:hypothetical protein
MAPMDDAAVALYSELLAQSYERWTGTSLVEGSDISSALYQSDIPVVSHGTETDPIFCYANLAAQRIFEMTWEEFTQLPSRMSAEPVEQNERAELLNKAARKGYFTGYSGIRVAKSGRRFRISDTVVWDVLDSDGKRVGQAAAIHKVTFL